MLSGLAVFQNLMLGGRAIAYLTVGLLTALTPIAIVSGSVPVAGAALMAITDAERLGFTLIGGALVLLSSTIALGWARFQQAHRTPA
jgi:hypothetical protein